MSFVAVAHNTSRGSLVRLLMLSPSPSALLPPFLALPLPPSPASLSLPLTSQGHFSSNILMVGWNRPGVLSVSTRSLP